MNYKQFYRLFYYKKVKEEEKNMLKATGKQQTLKAAVLSAVMVMSAIGMNVADAALNEARVLALIIM